LEEFALSIDQLNRTILSVVLVPIQVEDTGPGIHRTPKLFGERRVRGSHSHAEIQVPLSQQFGVPIAGRIVRTPIRGSLRISDADEDEQQKKN
jgi:DNA topoisomerase VI subunit B